MSRRLIIATLATLLLTTSVFAQGLPPGKWWRRPEIVRVLALTEEQQSRLDTIFRDAANDLIDRRGEVEKQNIALRGALDETQPNRDAVRRMAAKLNEARGRLFERELMMLVDMRGVLSEAQWSRMRNEIAERMENREQHRPQNRQQNRPGGKRQ